MKSPGLMRVILLKASVMYSRFFMVCIDGTLVRLLLWKYLHPPEAMTAVTATTRGTAKITCEHRIRRCAGARQKGGQPWRRAMPRGHATAPVRGTVRRGAHQHGRGMAQHTQRTRC